MAKIKKSTPRAQRRRNKKTAIKKSQLSANSKYTSSRSVRRASERANAKLKRVSKKSTENIPTNQAADFSFSNLDIDMKAELLACFVFGENQSQVLNTIDLITTQHASRLEENKITFYFNEFDTEELILHSPFDPEIAHSCLIHLYKLMMINKAPLPPHKTLLINMCMIEQDNLFQKIKPQRSLQDVITLLEGYLAQFMPDTHIEVKNYIKNIVRLKPNAILFDHKDQLTLGCYLNDDFDIDHQIRCMNIFLTASRLSFQPKSNIREILEYSVNFELTLLIKLINKVPERV